MIHWLSVYILKLLWQRGLIILHRQDLFIAIPNMVVCLSLSYLMRIRNVFILKLECQLSTFTNQLRCALTTCWKHTAQKLIFQSNFYFFADFDAFWYEKLLYATIHAMIQVTRSVVSVSLDDCHTSLRNNLQMKRQVLSLRFSL